MNACCSISSPRYTLQVSFPLDHALAVFRSLIFWNMSKLTKCRRLHNKLKNKMVTQSYVLQYRLQKNMEEFVDTLKMDWEWPFQCWPKRKCTWSILNNSRFLVKHLNIILINPKNTFISLFFERVYLTNYQPRFRTNIIKKNSKCADSKASWPIDMTRRYGVRLYSGFRWTSNHTLFLNRFTRTTASGEVVPYWRLI